MDAIASSTGILWLFGILFGLPAALSVLAVLLWKYKNNQRLSLIFYAVSYTHLVSHRRCL